MVRTLTSWGLWSAAILVSTVAALSVAGMLMLFGWKDGTERLRSDWTRLTASHRMDASEDVERAFADIYGARLGSRPEPAVIRRWFAGELESDNRAVLDAVMTAYVVERFDRIDNRSLPAGMYVGAGPIGPDPWPFPVLSHYLFYPRHAYLLVVPHDGEEAREATASISRKFDKGRASGDLSARFYPYQKGSYDFARPEAPVHDLLRITDNRNETDAVLRRLDDAVERIRDAELPYLVLSKNSNTALGCLLLASGLPRPTFDRFRRPLLVQLRLPGIGGDLWSEDADEAISECTEGG